MLLLLLVVLAICFVLYRIVILLQIPEPIKKALLVTILGVCLIFLVCLLFGAVPPLPLLRAHS
jgi:hypothetical protein